MRFVIVGAGAVGGVVGARLALAGEDVAFVARGEHGRTIAAHGIVLEEPTGDTVVPVPTVATLAEAGLREGDVVLLAVKSQDTAGVLADLVDACGAAGGLEPPVVCLQNGVDNERCALRLFEHVYAVTVIAPTEHLRPGVVRAYSTPTPGLLDIGRWPAGVDATAEGIAAAFARAGFPSDARADISRSKYRKLILNLGNAVEALCGPGARGGELDQRVAAEGEAVLAAAGIDVATLEEDLGHRGSRITWKPVHGERRGGGSTWQSLARGQGSVEVDALNGEIALLGRLHGVPTPVNARLQRLMHDAVRQATPPGTFSESDILGSGR